LAFPKIATSIAMSIRRIRLIEVAVPLKKAIKHASHARTESANLIVRVELDDGTVGHGEGVPRAYVTGETIESTMEVLSRPDWSQIVGTPADFPDAVRRLEALSLPEIEADPRGMDGNAARCALELALLDAYGRRFGESLGRAVELAERDGLDRRATPGPVRYSAAITSESPHKERVSAWKYRIYGFQQVKIKVGVAGQDDPARLAVLRKILGPRRDLRLDANEAWPAAELLDRVALLRPFGPTALEQPVPHGEVNSLTELRPQLGVPVMLDESLCGIPDAAAAIRDRTADLLNVRLSKCGGILPSLTIMAMAFRAGLGVQLGCHPGETAILSAAGRHVASRLNGIRYLEGSYDRHILSTNVSRQDITFGYGGRARPIQGPGLGIDVDPDAIDRMTVSSRELSYD
jgi:muconate cycloisomerase